LAKGYWKQNYIRRKYRETVPWKGGHDKSWSSKTRLAGAEQTAPGWQSGAANYRVAVYITDSWWPFPGPAPFLLLGPELPAIYAPGPWTHAPSCFWACVGILKQNVRSRYSEIPGFEVRRNLKIFFLPKQFRKTILYKRCEY
jgi:hypothetical protein